MTIYTVTKSDERGLHVQYEDGSWAILPATVDMLPEDIDDLAAQFQPKQLQAPAFMTVGTQRSAVAKPAEEPVDDGDIPDTPYVTARIEAYGIPEAQLEYITENGLEAWQAHVAEIKAANPKPE